MTQLIKVSPTRVYICMYVHIPLYVHIYIYVYIRKLPALHGLVSRFLVCTARHCRWQAENPVARVALTKATMHGFAQKTSLDSQFHSFARYSIEGPCSYGSKPCTAYGAKFSTTLLMASIEPHCMDLHRRPLARICKDLPKFDVARICTQNVQVNP